MRKAIAILAGLAVLVVASYTIHSRERQLAEGAVVLLELAPVDPRSLMQGDYMALRFRMANDAGAAVRAAASTDGRIVAIVDERGVATYRGLHDGTPVASNEVLLRYRVRNGDIKFATNAFFFQEGTGRRYEGARYGELRVAPDGELLLTGLRDKDLRPL